MNEEGLLRAAISEYGGIVGSKDAGSNNNAVMERLAHELCSRHDWTDDGARALVALANNYGAFMLRNALAVAVALGKEDGDLGF